MDVEGDLERIKRAKAALDDAVSQYKTEIDGAWGNDNGGMLVGWTLGIAVSRYVDNEEEDNLLIESAPGMNNYMARGVADATAERFQMQASGFGDEID